MKKFAVLILIFTIALPAFANSDMKMVLCASKGIKLTEAHLEKMCNYFEISLNRELSEEELRIIKKELLNSFIKNPVSIIQSIDGINQEIERISGEFSINDNYYVYQKLFQRNIGFFSNFSISSDIKFLFADTDCRLAMRQK